VSAFPGCGEIWSGVFTRMAPDCYLHRGQPGGRVHPLHCHPESFLGQAAQESDFRGDKDNMTLNTNTALMEEAPSAHALPKVQTRAKSVGKNILIVDDDPDTRCLLEHLLANDGYDVHTAESAESAMALLFSSTPDAVLMDVRLPGMDGMELTRLIKLAGKSKRMPILAVSASVSDVNVQYAYDSGCDGFIGKPVNPRTFAATVGKYLDLD
jgi:two-component system cell cycle response regulator DivK